MAQVTTSKAIDLAQLSGEMSGAALSMSTVGGSSTIVGEAVTQAALDTAVTAHVAINRDGNRATLQQQAQAALAANRTFVAIASPTNAQVAAQVKALTRQNNGIIRLLLGQFDGTD